MSTRRELILDALRERFRELCEERILLLAPAHFGEMSGFVSRVRQGLRFTEIGDPAPSDCELPNGWVASDSDCLTALRSLAEGAVLTFRQSQRPSNDAFPEQLQIARRDHARRFQLLTERYACPVNFAATAEDEVREHILERLMVHDRAQIERSSIIAVDSDDLLLKLNLCAIEALTAGSIAAEGSADASLTIDLRFLDALNYYYELIPANWRPHTQHHWLLVSYLALYARALKAWLLRYECEQAS